MPIAPETAEALAMTEGGLAAAAEEELGPDASRKYEEEKKQVKMWLSRIEAARAFDSPVWKQMAMDRRYAAGYSEFEVSTNLIGSAIDVMKSFLYAKDPDLAITPAPTVLPPKPVKPTPPPPLPAAIQQALDNPLAAGQQLAETAGPMLPQILSVAAPMIQNYEAQKARYMQEEQLYRAAVEQRRQMRDQRRKFSETLQIVASKAWKTGRLKPAMKNVTGSGLTVGIGWLKATWREDRGLDPITQQRVNSITDNIARIDRLKEQMLDPAGVGADELDRMRQQLAEELVGLNSKTEAIRSRGMVFDPLCSDDLTFPIGVTNVAEPTNSPWIDHKLFYKYDDCAALFPGLKPEKLKKATRYSQIEPVAPSGEGTPLWCDGGDWQPGQFRAGDGTRNVVDGTNTTPDANGDFVCVHETWDRTANLIRTTIEGVECYAKPPHAPEIATSRFYPFFAVAYTEVDGQRYPQSLVFRSYKLADEYNRTRSAWAEARRRSKAGVIFDEAAVDKDTMGRLTDGATGEWTGVKTVNGQDMRTVFASKPTTTINPALYDTAPIRRDFEDIWGIQQALSGGVSVEKTATEAEIQQQGFGARSGYMRDATEVMLNELASYTAEILLQRLTPDDARMIAGEGAVWPETFTVDDLETLVDVKIEAGSTGKPNTAAQRAAWAATMPLLQALVEKVGMMRGASAEDIADKLENLVAITLRRGGDDSIDIESLVPQEGGGEPAVPEGMGTPGGAEGPVIAPPQPQPPSDITAAPEMAM